MTHVKEKDKIIARCEHKADKNHSIVSAASILAKVTRDEEIEKIKKKYNIECGSGYPADPLCKKFLKEHGDEYAKLGIVRKTWMTWKNHVTKKSQKKIADF
jgi:ribonuclease HII